MSDYGTFVSSQLPQLVRYSVMLTGDRDSADDLGAAHTIRDDMWQRLATLPRRQRAVLVLRYYERLTDAEIADVLGCSPVGVRGYAHRALARLRTDLSAELINETKGI